MALTIPDVRYGPSPANFQAGESILFEYPVYSDTPLQGNLVTGVVLIRDARGGVVRTLEKEITVTPEAAGKVRVLWDGTDERGNRLPAGDYAPYFTARGRNADGTISSVSSVACSSGPSRGLPFAPRRKACPCPDSCSAVPKEPEIFTDLMIDESRKDGVSAPGLDRSASPASGNLLPQHQSGYQIVNPLYKNIDEALPDLKNPVLLMGIDRPMYSSIYDAFPQLRGAPTRLDLPVVNVPTVGQVSGSTGFSKTGFPSR